MLNITYKTPYLDKKNGIVFIEKSCTTEFSHDSTPSFYEKDFSTASITEEDIQPKGN